MKYPSVSSDALVLPSLIGIRHKKLGRSRSYVAIGSNEAAPRKRNPFLECATLFWLGQSDRALRALCRGPAAEHNAYCAVAAARTPGVDKSSASVGSAPTSTITTDKIAGLGLCNRAIDVATRPLLVSKLAPQDRRSGFNLAARRASANGGGGGWTLSPGRASNGDSAGGGKVAAPDSAQRVASVRLTTVEYLARNGMELSALEVLGSSAGSDWAAALSKHHDVAEEGQSDEAPTTVGRGKMMGDPGDVAGGVFAGFSRPLSGSSTAQPKSSSGAASGELSGDMFGGFDGPPRAKPATSATTTAAAASSGELSGDMFGGFDGPPRQRPAKTVASKAAADSGQLSGDMFGGFDGPPRSMPKPAAVAKTTSSASASASGELSGGMFDGFDGPPRKAPEPTKAPKDAMASGELSGDLFGGFDRPKRKEADASSAPVEHPKTPEKTRGTVRGSPRLSNPSTVASGELSSDLFASFDGPPADLPAHSAQSSPAPSSIWTPGSSRSSMGSPFESHGSRRSSRGGSSQGYGYWDGEEPSWDSYDSFAESQHGDYDDGVET